MEVYLEDIQEAEAAVVRAKRTFLEERGWKDQYVPHSKNMFWKKTFVQGNGRDKATTDVSCLTTEEAIDLEKCFGLETHKPEEVVNVA